MFKVGDTVKCIKISEEAYSALPFIGEDYKVIDTKANQSDKWFLLYGDNSRNKLRECCFLKEDFVLVEPKLSTKATVLEEAIESLEKEFGIETHKRGEPKKEGIRYNSNKLRWRNFPLFLIKPLVEVGAAAEKREGNPTGKYPTYNFLKGLSVADCLDSLHRHLESVVDPTQSDIDPEDNCHHLAKIAWNALVALYYIKTRPDLDDRYKGENK